MSYFTALTADQWILFACGVGAGIFLGLALAHIAARRPVKPSTDPLADHQREQMLEHR